MKGKVLRMRVTDEQLLSEPSLITCTLSEKACAQNPRVALKDVCFEFRHSVGWNTIIQHGFYGCVSVSFLLLSRNATNKVDVRKGAFILVHSSRRKEAMKVARRQGNRQQVRGDRSWKRRSHICNSKHEAESTSYII